MDRTTFCHITISHLEAIQKAFNQLIEDDPSVKEADRLQRVIEGHDIHLSCTVDTDVVMCFSLATVEEKTDDPEQKNQLRLLDMYKPINKPAYINVEDYRQ